MSVSLPSVKLLEVQQLVVHSFLQRELDAVHQVMSFLGETTFCANGHAQLWQLCNIIQSDMLNVYHSPADLFLSFHLSLPAWH